MTRYRRPATMSAAMMSTGTAASGSAPAGRAPAGPALTALRGGAVWAVSFIRAVVIPYIAVQVVIWHSFYSADAWRLAGPVAALAREAAGGADRGRRYPGRGGAPARGHRRGGMVRPPDARAQRRRDRRDPRAGGPGCPRAARRPVPEHRAPRARAPAARHGAQHAHRPRASRPWLPRPQQPRPRRPGRGRGPMPARRGADGVRAQ